MHTENNPPPSKIDGARIIEWAWSGDTPFGEVQGPNPDQIFGLAIATYNDQEFYRFSCDKNWETQQDSLYNSIEEAKAQLPQQYKRVEANWISMRLS